VEAIDPGAPEAHTTPMPTASRPANADKPSVPEQSAEAAEAKPTPAPVAGKPDTTRDVPAEPESREPAVAHPSDRTAVFQTIPQTKPENFDIRMKSSVQPVSKPELQEPQAQPAAAVRDLSLRLSGADRQSIDIRLVDRGGEIHVAVRTANDDLARGLRTDLADLAGRLDHSGFHAEIFRPAEAAFSQADRGNAQSGAEQGGSGRQSQQQNSGQREEQQQPEWADEIARLAPNASFSR